MSDEKIKEFGDCLKNAYFGNICPIEFDAFGQEHAAEIRKEIDEYLARKEGKDGGKTDVQPVGD